MHTGQLLTAATSTTNQMVENQVLLLW